ncbi:hypothetical protein [Chitiniphilus shinanonensis]|uniref:hypothetical protein n=1 Tax=Chitiniphilus shinanonensis TaxID=553088 RepID=UPI00302871B2
MKPGTFKRGHQAATPWRNDGLLAGGAPRTYTPTAAEQAERQARLAAAEREYIESNAQISLFEEFGA